MLQVLRVREVKETVSPEVELAVTSKGTLEVSLSGIESKVIVCPGNGVPETAAEAVPCTLWELTVITARNRTE